MSRSFSTSFTEEDLQSFSEDEIRNIVESLGYSSKELTRDQLIKIYLDSQGGPLPFRLIPVPIISAKNMSPQKVIEVSSRMQPKELIQFCAVNENICDGSDFWQTLYEINISENIPEKIRSGVADFKTEYLEIMKKYYSGADEIRYSAIPEPEVTYGKVLIEMAMEGADKLVEKSLELGADPDFSNYYGGSSLAWASGRRHLKIVKILIAAGADVDHVIRWSWTPLFNAVYSGHLDIVKELIKAGVNPLIRNDEKGMAKNLVGIDRYNKDPDYKKNSKEIKVLLDRYEKEYLRRLGGYFEMIPMDLIGEISKQL